MLTYKNLGYYGRFGNQLFQYAALVGIANKIGCSYGINYQNAQTERIITSFVGPEKLELVEAFNLSAEDISNRLIPTKICHEKKFNFDRRFFDLNSELDADLFGYFHTEKYFSHCVDKIRSEFEFKPNIRKEAERQIEQLRDGKPLVSLHVRRGDYSKVEYLNPCRLSYYNKAISLFKNCKFIIFSNDIPWCQQNFISGNFVYVADNNKFVDMCMMRLCDHHIIANSSFGWWGAWLNPSQSKKVVAPRKWFELFSAVNGQDIYCDDWIILGTWHEHVEWVLTQFFAKFEHRIWLERLQYCLKYPNRLVPEIKAKLVSKVRH